MFSKSVMVLSKSFSCHRAGYLNYVHVVFYSTALEKLSPVQVIVRLHCSCPSNQLDCPLCPGEDRE